MTFVSLHTHSEFSLLDGLASVKSIVAKAAQDGQPAIAVTDHGNVLGMVDLFDSCKKHSIKPIFGCEVYVAPGSRFTKKTQTTMDDNVSLDPSGQRDTGYHLVLLAKNHTGFQNLNRLVTSGYTEGYYYKPRVDKELLTEYSEGLICLSACLGGELQQALYHRQTAKAQRIAEEYKSIFGNDYYIEIHNHRLPDDEQMVEELTGLGSRLGISMVAANDAHYLDATDTDVHDILLCIGTYSQKSDQDRMRFPNGEFYFKTAAEMAKLFEPMLLETSIEIASKVENFSILNSPTMPKFPVPDGYTLDSYFLKMATLGLERRLVECQPLFTSGFLRYTQEAYRQRLQYEVDMIIKMGFPGYFLIVWDFIRYAKQAGISVGPGRGSAAGSIVAWSLRITDVDPLQYDLVFERFLNPERVSLPDIDIDFCRDKRQDVIGYVREHYGADHVAGIATVNRLQPKSAIKDVARALGKGFHWSNMLTRAVPSMRGKSPSIREAIQDGELCKLYTQDPDAKEVLDVAMKLEGVARSQGVHAAGIIIAPGRVEDSCASFVKDGALIVQHEMSTVERVGLVKIDFLGLEQLTQVAYTRKFIAQRGKSIDEQALETMNDPRVFQLYGDGDTDGVFQFESSGMKKYLQRLKPDRFEDLIAMNALYRPGPLDAGMIDTYIERRHGREAVEYPIPEIEHILAPTYGVLIYQEQIMQIAQVVAGFTLGEADLLRRAIGKKDAEKLQKSKQGFIDKSVARGFDALKIEGLFALIEKFCDYGFNRAHACAYAQFSYQTAYFKAYFPAEFMAGLLTAKSKKSDDMVKYIQSCKTSGLTLLGPDLNESETDFTILNDTTLRFGLSAVKGLGDRVLDQLVSRRHQGGPYRSLVDFMDRSDKRYARKVADLLIKGGAMDSFGIERDKMAAQAEALATRKNTKKPAKCMPCLFSDEEMEAYTQDWEAALKYDLWSEAEKLAYEYAILGFYASAHPVDRYAEVIRRNAIPNINMLRELVNEDEVRDEAKIIVGGMLRKVEHKVSKTGSSWASLFLEDSTGQLECCVFSRNRDKKTPYDDNRHMMYEGKIVLLHGKASVQILDNDSREVKLFVDRITDINTYGGSDE
jgi:DNA polymerase-3 subunit alpha